MKGPLCNDARVGKPRTWEIAQKVVRGRRNRSCGPRTSCTGAKRGLHGCKEGFGWCKRLLGDCAPWVHKILCTLPLLVIFSFRSNFPGPRFPNARVRKAPDTFNFLRHVMRAVLSARPKCSHRCVSLKETPLKPVQVLKHATKKLSRANVCENEMV